MNTNTSKKFCGHVAIRYGILDMTEASNEGRNQLLSCLKQLVMIISGREGTTVVAVKTLKENASDKERSDLVQELQVMKMLEPHPNVVRLLGCCTEKGTSRMCYLSTLFALSVSSALSIGISAVRMPRSFTETYKFHPSKFN